MRHWHGKEPDFCSNLIICFTFYAFSNLYSTVNPQISSLGAYVFVRFLHWGLFEGGGLKKIF